MLALLPTDGSDPLVEIDEAPEPLTAPDEALIRVEALSINRGETFLLERPNDGWRPGRDISGRVVRAAARRQRAGRRRASRGSSAAGRLGRASWRFPATPWRSCLTRSTR